jgi:hypothetical protein
MPTYPDLPTITLTPPPAPHLAFALEPASPLSSTDQQRVDSAWADLRRDNPDLHDGEILLVDLPALTAGRLAVRPGPFRLLAAANRAGLKVRALGVQAVLIGTDVHGVEHLLLGRRSPHTRLYHAQWENAPSGSVEPPKRPGTPIDAAHCVDALVNEGVEELGFDLRAAPERWLGVLEDAEASSLDVVLELRLPGATNPRGLPCPRHDAGRWEYMDTAWIALPDLPAWTKAHARAVSPPTLALLRWLNWS